MLFAVSFASIHVLTLRQLVPMTPGAQLPRELIAARRLRNNNGLVIQYLPGRYPDLLYCMTLQLVTSSRSSLLIVAC
jgi:hypothetical protein